MEERPEPGRGVERPRCVQADRSPMAAPKPVPRQHAERPRRVQMDVSARHEEIPFVLDQSTPEPAAEEMIAPAFSNIERSRVATVELLHTPRDAAVSDP